MKDLLTKSKGMALAAFPLLAQSDKEINLRPDEGIGAKLQTLTIGSIVAAALKLALIIAAVVFFFILVVGGIRWILSGGDKAHTETARSQITAALVGLVIVFAAWAITRLIGTFFGVEVLNLTLPTAK
jgi:hypothetical protein